MSEDEGKNIGTVVSHHHQPQYAANRATVVSHSHHHQPQYATNRATVVSHSHHHQPQYGTTRATVVSHSHHRQPQSATTRATVVSHRHEPQSGTNSGTVVSHHHEPQYGTFPGVPNYPPPLPPQHHHHQPAIGLPQPVPPPGAAPSFYPDGYQTVTGYAVVEGRPYIEPRLPCCGIGLGWFMFIVGFFLAAIPWYVGAIILACSRIDYREKPGYIACTIAAILATLAAMIGATKGADDW